MSPKITALKVRTALVPLPEPHLTASGTIVQSPLILTDIHTDAGVVGHGLVFSYTPAALKAVAEMVRGLEPLLIDQPLAPAELEQQLRGRFRLLGEQGLVGIAIAAVDMALWDAKAKLQEQNLVTLFGGQAKDVPVYGGIGYNGERHSAEAAEAWAKLGLLGVKAKVGYPTVQEDVAVLRAIRSAVGDELVVMADYNQCLTPAEAIERLRVLEDEGLTWVEEPTLAHDYQGHAQIRAEVKTPIQCGENWWGTQDLSHAIHAGASDYIMPDVMKIGGVSGWRRAAALAEVHQLKVSCHLWPEISYQLLCVTPTFHWLEYCDWWNPILAEPLVVENGIAQLSDTPGNGMRWNEEAVAKYLC